jgi:hypothetical protein
LVIFFSFSTGFLVSDATCLREIVDFGFWTDDLDLAAATVLAATGLRATLVVSFALAAFAFFSASSLMSLALVALSSLASFSA